MSHSEQADATSQAWRAMSDLVLNQNRKAAVSEELGLSFARVRALRRLVDTPRTLRELAAKLNADPPYVTLMVDDLEQRGLVQRTPHPQDRRAKLVQLTPEGRRVAVRADEILGRPPTALLELPADDVSTLLRILEQLTPATTEKSRPDLPT